MILDSFLDELVKLGVDAGVVQVGDVVMGSRSPKNALGVMVRQAMSKHADLATLHAEIAPPADEVNPRDASTRLPRISTPPLVRAGNYGEITQSRYPIDRERFNRAWNQPLR